MKPAFFEIEATIISVSKRNNWFWLYNLLFILLVCVSCTIPASREQILPFVVSIDRHDTIVYPYVMLDYKKVLAQFDEKSLAGRKLQVRDLNNDEILSPCLIDNDHDNVPEFIKLDVAIKRNEPLRPFELIITEEKSGDMNCIQDNSPEMGALEITYLTDYHEDSLFENPDPEWTNTIASSFISSYPDPADLEAFEPGEWTYTNGFFLNALCYADALTDTNIYLAYVKQWLDLFVNDEGIIDTLKYSKELYRLDDILPGRALLYVYKQTGDSKYLKAAGVLIDQLKKQPRTSTGGYWHKKVYDWQMWLDGIYMGDVFLLQYAELTGRSEYADEAIMQIKLAYQNTLDTVTGLLAHGWDESRSKIWSDPVNGKSPEFWGRGMGWYMMALVDALDYIPADHPQRSEVLEILGNVSGALLKYQESITGLWYQVLDKADRDGNWPEASCTAMFAYAFLKGHKLGCLPPKYKDSALAAYQGLKDQFIYFDEKGKLYLTGTVKVGTLNPEVSNGSFEYYVSVDRRVNDFKGVGALLYLAIADELLKNENPGRNE